MLCLRLHFPSMLACHFELYAHFRFSQWRRFSPSLPHSCCCYFSSLISSSWPSRKFFFFARIALLRLTANAPGNDIRHGLPRSAKQLSFPLCMCVFVLVTCGSTSVRHFQLQLPAWPLRGSSSLSTGASASVSSPATASVLETAAIPVGAMSGVSFGLRHLFLLSLVSCFVPRSASKSGVHATATATARMCVCVCSLRLPVSHEMRQLDKIAISESKCLPPCQLLLLANF